MKIKIKSIIYFLIMLYPILPVNFYIGSFSYANLCSLLIVLIYMFFIEEKKIINICKFNFPFWLYLIVYCLFAFFTSNLFVGIAWFFSTILVSLVLIDLVRTEKDFNFILDLIIVASVVLSIIGIYEAFSHTYLIQSELLPVSENIRYGILRSTGPFGICINFGLYQAISGIIIFYRLNVEKSAQKKNKYKIAYVLVVLSVFLSVSRLAICLFIAAQIIMYFQLGMKKGLKNICFGICGIAVIVLILDTMGLTIFNLFNDFFISFFELIGFETQINNSDIVGFGNRTDLYDWVLEAIKENLIFGMGVDAKFAFEMTSWFTKTSIEVHYLYILFHCGIIGLFFLIISYLYTLKYFWNNRKIKNDTNERISFIKLLFIVVLLYYICLFGVQETDLTRFYCELISLGIIYIRINKKKNNNLENKNEFNV